MTLDPHSPSLLSTPTHLERLAQAAGAMTRAARETWLGAPVPTCPDWTVLDLVAHQGMVHRWATAAVRLDPEGMGNAASRETEGRTSADPIGWLEAGAADLIQALGQAPDDLDTLVFLKEAPRAKAFWARRQCHETTVHALDALGAVRGRPLTCADAWFDDDLALDGIDELLIGFWQRGKFAIRSAIPYAVLVRPDTSPVAWVVTISDGPVRSRRIDPEEQVAVDLTLSGTPVDLYLALWNRGGSPADPDGALDRFREGGAITW